MGREEDAVREAKLNFLTRLIEHYEYNYDDTPFGDDEFDMATSARDCAVVLLARLDQLDAALGDKRRLRTRE